MGQTDVEPEPETLEVHELSYIGDEDALYAGFLLESELAGDIHEFILGIMRTMK